MSINIDWENAIKIFNEFINAISIVNNIVQFAALFMAVITIVFVFSHKYIKMIKHILTPLGFKNRDIIKVLFLCRKNPHHNIRVFCEYFILRTQGQHRNAKWWKFAFSDFTEFFKDAEDKKYTYTIDNCTILLNEDISQLIVKYFCYLDNDNVKRNFNLNSKTLISSCISVKISQGFLSSNILLSGLLERYKNDWGNLVDKYIATASNETHKDKIYASELYYTFAWLLWGPSYQIENQDGHYKLCQYSFGDESNSINIILNDDEKLKKIWEELESNKNGILCSLECKIFDSKKYINYNRDKFNPVNTYFNNKVADNGLGFVLEPFEYDIKFNYAARNYYSTAYVWIMFETLKNETNPFLPQKTITFFEHANMANDINYYECINSLINKSFLHFDAVFSETELKRKYRYCISMNSEIEAAFKKELNKRLEKNDNLSIKYKECFLSEPMYNESCIFSAFDSYFTDNNDEFEYVEVSISDEKSMALLGEFYTSIYMESFPSIDERESLDSIIDYLTRKNNGAFGRNNYHIILAVKSHKIQGGAIFDYFEKSNCAVIEFIAIKKIYQSNGVGSRLYQKILENVCKDASIRRHHNVDYIFCEIEKVKESLSNEDKYIWFWNKMGYKKLDFDYVQPALEAGKDCVNTLDLIVLQVGNVDERALGLRRSVLKNFLLDYAKYSMRIDEPQNRNEIKEMFQQIDLEEKEVISYLPIIKKNKLSE